MGTWSRGGLRAARALLASGTRALAPPPPQAARHAASVAGRAPLPTALPTASSDGAPLRGLPTAGRPLAWDVGRRRLHGGPPASFSAAGGDASPAPVVLKARQGGRRRSPGSTAAAADPPAAELPLLAIVGRPNVGKSAVFNRLLRRRDALVWDTPAAGAHVTRDHREGVARLGDLRFRVVDSAGLEFDEGAAAYASSAAAAAAAPSGRGPSGAAGGGSEAAGSERSNEVRPPRHAPAAAAVAAAAAGAAAGARLPPLLTRSRALTAGLLQRCSAALLVLDARAGLLPDDEAAARWLRRSGAPPVLVVANKAEGRESPAMAALMGEAARLGFGEPVAISAETGEGMADLYARLQPGVDAATAVLRAAAAAARGEAGEGGAAGEMGGSGRRLSKREAEEVGVQAAGAAARAVEAAWASAVEPAPLPPGRRRAMRRGGAAARARDAAAALSAAGLDQHAADEEDDEDEDLMGWDDEDDERLDHVGAAAALHERAGVGAGDGSEADDEGSGGSEEEEEEEEGADSREADAPVREEEEEPAWQAEARRLTAALPALPPAGLGLSEGEDEEWDARRAWRAPRDGAGAAGDGSEASLRARLTAEDACEEILVALAGRVNAGKSTLLNALLGRERALTGPEPGLTRDPVRATVEVPNPFYLSTGAEDGADGAENSPTRSIALLDTAGWVPRSRLRSAAPAASLAAMRSREWLRRAHVVALVVDAAAAPRDHPLARAELALAAEAAQEGRAVVLIANKIDALPPSQRSAALKAFAAAAEAKMPLLAGLPVLGISALTGHNLNTVLPAIVAAHRRWCMRLPTGRLNRWISKLAAAKTGLGKGSGEGRVRYLTQVRSRPPTFAAFLTGGPKIQDSALRHLASALRSDFGLHGVPVRVWPRSASDSAVERQAGSGASARRKPAPHRVGGAGSGPPSRPADPTLAFRAKAERDARRGGGARAPGGGESDAAGAPKATTSPRGAGNRLPPRGGATPSRSEPGRAEASWARQIAPTITPGGHRPRPPRKRGAYLGQFAKIT